jgi:hypothetical protein
VIRRRACAIVGAFAAVRLEWMAVLVNTRSASLVRGPYPGPMDIPLEREHTLLSL